MKIKLIQTGGLLPLTREAVIDIDLPDHQLKDLISAIKLSDEHNQNARDALYYLLEINGDEISIDIHKIPERYKELFNNLKQKLTTVKFKQ